VIARAFELFSRRLDGPLMATLALTVALGATVAARVLSIGVVSSVFAFCTAFRRRGCTGVPPLASVAVIAASCIGVASM